MSQVFLTGLDVGSTYTRAVIGEYVRELNAPVLRVLGVGCTPTAGVRHDSVTDLEEAARTIRRSIQEAELMAGLRIDRVYVGVSGDHLEATRSVGVVAIAGEEVQRRDVKRVHAVARAVPAARGRELLHAFPQHYTVDNQPGVKDPVGMAGTRLETQLYLVTGCAATLGNVVRAVERAGYRVQDIVLEPLAASRAVLSEDEMELGVATVDMGGTTTGIAVHFEGRIQHLEVLPYGGNTVTSELIRGLSVPFAEARRIKERFAAGSGAIAARETIRLNSGNGNGREVAGEFVAQLIEERLEHIFLQIGRKLDDVVTPTSTLGSGVVVTGGVAVTPGIDEVAGRSMAVPIRVGTVGTDISGLVDRLGHPGFATATGLALIGADYYGETGGGATTAGSGVAARVGAWIREFF